ncbi:MAG: hypothetical protein ACE5HY_04435 [Candidatus Hydrothermarchaeales archaeon]
MVVMNISQIALLVAGAILIFVAPKVVGTILKIIGVALILVGVVIYKFPAAFVSGGLSSTWALIIAGLPAIAGLGILTVGKGMAKMAVRIAGLLLIIAALASMGII